MSWRARFEDQGFVIRGFSYLIMILSITGALITIRDVNLKTSLLTDYLAYSLPMVAAVLAGMGLYLEDDARMLFGLSCVILVLGLLSYLASKDLLGIGLTVLLIGACGIAIGYTTDVTPKLSSRRV